jgi:hypothetical protein
MSEAGERLIEGAKEALAIARGEQPAARIHMEGHAYVPEETIPAREAKERRRIAYWLATLSDQTIRLHCGEMTAQEMRTVKAFRSWISTAIRKGRTS